MANAPTDAALTITTDPSRLDLDLIHGFLAASYWAAGIPRQIVERSLRHSLGFGAFDGDRQARCPLREEGVSRRRTSAART